MENWSQEAKETFSRLASRLATDSSQPKSKVIADLYGRLHLTLMKVIARAILARDFRAMYIVMKHKYVQVMYIILHKHTQQHTLDKMALIGGKDQSARDLVYCVGLRPPQSSSKYIELLVTLPPEG